MDDPVIFNTVAVVVGSLLIAMTLGSTFISRLPLSTSMLYLCVGVAIGPWGFDLVSLNPLEHSTLLERLTEVAVLISLFTVGMKLELPLKDRRWRLPVQLASVSMLVTVAAIAAVGVLLMGMSVGAAVLLGAILAPTDPVLASDVQVADTKDRDRLRFGLTGEGGLNDGTAFPLVMLGLGLMGLHELGAYGWHWWTVDLLWAIAGGLGLGYLLGWLVGKAILHLRIHHRNALGSDEFIALGLIALTYGLAIICHTYGFLAVFAAGLALRRSDDQPRGAASSQVSAGTPGIGPDAQAEPADTSAEGKESAAMPAKMMYAVEQFNTQLEKFVEVALMLAVGIMLADVQFSIETLWFIPVLFLVIRPVAVIAGLLGTGVQGTQRRLIAWFGIRGIGSLYYLMYAINHGLEPMLAEYLLSITVAVVVASVFVHGISVTPLMSRYEARKKARIRSA